MTQKDTYRNVIRREIAFSQRETCKKGEVSSYSVFSKFLSRRLPNYVEDTRALTPNIV